MTKQSITNLVIRALTIGSKFLLILYLARILPIEQLGIYGLFTASINYSLYFLGFDYYTYTTRKLLTTTPDNWAPILRDQFFFYLISYSICFPFILLLFGFNILPRNLIFWFLLILFIEHFSQEIYRILVNLQRPVLANILAFIRLGLWVYVVLACYIFTDIAKNLELLWWGWAFGGGTCIVLGSYVLYNQVYWSLLWETPVDWTAIRLGARTASRFLMATLSLRAIFTLDRYLVEYTGSIERVGVYSFFMSIANSISSFLDAGVFIFNSPKVIQSYQIRDMKQYNYHRSQMRKSVILWLFILCTAVVTLIKPLLGYIQKDEFISQIHTFHWLVGAIAILALSNLPHYELYAKGKDKAIIFATLFSFLIFLFTSWIFSQFWGSTGVAIAVTVSMTSLLLSKIMFNLTK